ncbi:condensation domain-containing protein [Nocardiopsis sp. JB363]|uniref:condensation domain-containing protein n=1 Tax=Nocardiopsis sp. JB363 TaxID=1434837 RepID=UPI00097A8FA5|nr:condensation domain-containing protein [Nocardiopsis sp. JB363]SIO90372.1 non-ribosomal peptide synthetase [Nocardiopsis sp. JB363]
MNGRRVGFGERGLWFMQQVTGTGVCNMSSAFRIRDELDTDLFFRSMATVIDRHPNLRARYRVHEGELRVLVAPTSGLRTHVVSAHGWSDSRITDDMRRIQSLPFDLANEPPCRLTIWYRENDHGSDHAALLTFHHATADAAGMVLAGKELFHLYDHGLDQSGLPEPGPPYEEFVEEQHALASSPAADEAVYYWTELLPRKRPAPPLPTGGVPGASDPRVVPFALPDGVAGGIATFARAHRVPSNVVLLALWSLTVHRVGGAEQLVVGLPRSLRRGRFAHTVGTFINTIPVVVDVPGDEDLSTIVAGLRTQLRASIKHQRFPMELLAQRLPSEWTDPNRVPVVDLMFNYVPLDGQDFGAVFVGALSDDSDITLGVAPFPTPASTGPPAEINLNHAQLGDHLAATITCDVGDVALAQELRERYIALAHTHFTPTEKS